MLRLTDYTVIGVQILPQYRDLKLIIADLSYLMKPRCKKALRTSQKSVEGCLPTKLRLFSEIKSQSILSVFESQFGVFKFLRIDPSYKSG